MRSAAALRSVIVSALRHWSPVLAAIVVAILLGVTRLAAPAPFEQLRLAAFDGLQRLSPRITSRASRIRVVAVDEESLARLGQWPWSRDVIANLVRALQDLGASAIGFDIVFAEADRTSPSRLEAGLLGASGNLADGSVASGAADYDHDLAVALARGRVVLGFGLLPRPNGRAPDIKAGFATVGSDPAATLSRFEGAVTNLPALEAAAEGLGSFTVVPGQDQVVRRLPLLQALGDQLVPSLSLESLRVALQADTVVVRARQVGGAQGQTIGYTLRLGDVEVPVDSDGAMWLHHARSDPEATIAAWRLLDPTQREAMRDRIAGHIIFIGASATGLVDLRATPLNPFEPGVNINAGAVDQILAGRFLSRPLWAGAAELTATATLAVALGGLVGVATMAAAAAAALGCGLAMLAAAWWAFQAGLLLDPTLCLLAVVLTFIVASLVRYLAAERAALRLRAAFSHYLAPQLVEQLARDPGRLRLGGEVREMTFLFTDLEGFTALTETQGAEALVHLLNRYLDGLCGIAVAHGGTLDKIVGDALHVMFNAPVDQPDHALRAVRCALEIDTFATAFAHEQVANGLKFGRTRIGVNTGRAVVGNFGGSRRFDYTAHGDAINTAARLEAANKKLGTRICVAQATAAHAHSDSFTFRPVGTLMLRGKAAGVEVFEPLAASDEAVAWAEPYTEAFAMLANGDMRGGAAILALHASHPTDPVLSLHAQRISEGQGLTPLAA